MYTPYQNGSVTVKLTTLFLSPYPEGLFVKESGIGIKDDG